MEYTVEDFIHEEEEEAEEPAAEFAEDSVRDICASLTDQEWERLAKWDRKGRFI